MSIRLLSKLLSLTVVSCLMSGSASANLLLNPGFELPDLVPPDNQAPGADDWETFNTAGVRTAQQNSGEQSLRLAPAAPTGTTDGIARQTFSASANQTYRFSSHVLHASDDPLTGDRRAELRLQWLNASDTLINQVVVPILDDASSADEWFFIGFEFSLPDNSNITQVRPSLFVTNNGGTGSGPAFFDDVNFELLSPSLAGNFDGDDDVDGSDFLEWQRSDGTPGGLSDWQTNFGAPPLSAVSSVPEPSSVITFLIGFTMLGHRAARRHRC